MSQENVETIRGLFRGVEERDLEAYLAVGHPEVVIREPDSLPYGGEYRGLDGLRRHAAGWMRSWAALQPGNERRLDATFIDAGDHVVARWRLKARAPDGDETLDMQMLGIYEMCEDPPEPEGVEELVVDTLDDLAYSGHPSPQAFGPAPL
jgi:ketosteroid isomerase-like protein